MGDGTILATLRDTQDTGVLSDEMKGCDHAAGGSHGWLKRTSVTALTSTRSVFQTMLRSRRPTSPNDSTMSSIFLQPSSSVSCKS